MQQKKIPLRQCLGCREQKPKKDLIRVVRSRRGRSALISAEKPPGGARISARIRTA